MSELFERAWPVEGAKAAVGIVHGLAEHSGRYEHVARALNDAGYAAYGIDLRGHGQSVGFPGEMGGDLDALVSDVVAFAVRLKAVHEKVFLLAHSMGTLLALPATAEAPLGTLDGLVLSGTGLLPGPAILESLGTGEGVPPELICRDPEVVKAYKEDPLVFYNRVPEELMGMAVEATQRASAAVPFIKVPVLLLHGTEDQICDRQGSEYVYSQLVVRDKEFKGYHGLYHEVLNEPEKEQVLKDLISWLDAH